MKYLSNFVDKLQFVACLKPIVIQLHSEDGL